MNEFIKIKEASLLTSKRFQSVYLEAGVKSMKYERVERLATDIDFHSLGNRMFGKEKRENELFPDQFDPDKDPFNLAARITRDITIEHESTALRPRYFIADDNIEEWGPVADQLMLAMLEMFVEYDTYDVVAEMRSRHRSKISVIGRIHQYEEQGQKEPPVPTEKEITRYSKKAQRHFHTLRVLTECDEMARQDVDASMIQEKRH